MLHTLADTRLTANSKISGKSKQHYSILIHVGCSAMRYNSVHTREREREAS